MKHGHVIIEQFATPADYKQLVDQLERLTLAEIRLLAHRLGMKFTSHAKTATKDEYINILDEVYWDDLEREYARVLRERHPGVEAVHVQENPLIRGVARLLFDGIDTATTDEQLRAAGEILDQLKPLLDRALDGVGTELWLWQGLKLDRQAAMADDYRGGIVRAYDDLLRRAND